MSSEMTQQEEYTVREESALAAEEAQQEALSDQQAETPSMTDEEALAAIEAILFTMGDSVEIMKLSSVTGKSIEETGKLIGRLQKRYERPDCGIELKFFEDSVQMCTKASQYENLIRIATIPRKLTLTETQLETLSIIAYRQPVTRAEVEEIRGVSCEHAVNRLLQYDLITELGRRDTPGRPILFGTTEQFLRSFGVRSLEELPSLDALQVEEFKEEAEDEVNTRLGI